MEAVKYGDLTAREKIAGMLRVIIYYDRSSATKAVTTTPTAW
jgi:hypothetical protein